MNPIELMLVRILRFACKSPNANANPMRIPTRTYESHANPNSNIRIPKFGFARKSQKCESDANPIYGVPKERFAVFIFKRKAQPFVFLILIPFFLFLIENCIFPFSFCNIIRVILALGFTHLITNPNWFGFAWDSQFCESQILFGFAEMRIPIKLGFAELVVQKKL